MSSDLSKPLDEAKQHLEQAIEQIRHGSAQDSLLPALETVLARLEDLAEHDQLTGALNERALARRLDAELARSARTGDVFSLAIVSVDGLEDIFEQHGQKVTRQILQGVAGEAAAMLRSVDSFGRTGANEFAILMPATAPESSRKAIARLRMRLEHVLWEEIAHGLRISLDTGLTRNAPGDDAAHMLQRAGAALQRARAQGSGAVSEIDPPPAGGTDGG